MVSLPWLSLDMRLQLQHRHLQGGPGAMRVTQLWRLGAERRMQWQDGREPR